jgi:hypothetical protein
MEIEVLHFAGCPNHPPTMELVRDIVRVLGLEATIREVVIRDAEEAMRLRFFGSPTVRVNGDDIDPGARSRSDYSFGCRLYGRSGSPPRTLVERALRARAMDQ